MTVPPPFHPYTYRMHHELMHPENPEVEVHPRLQPLQPKSRRSGRECGEQRSEKAPFFSIASVPEKAFDVSSAVVEKRGRGGR